jgi:hypothetical protein
MATTKMGPKEAQQRALREERAEKAKRLTVTKVKAVGKLTNIKAKHGGRGR